MCTLCTKAPVRVARKSKQIRCPHFVVKTSLPCMEALIVTVAQDKITHCDSLQQMFFYLIRDNIARKLQGREVCHKKHAPQKKFAVKHTLVSTRHKNSYAMSSRIPKHTQTRTEGGDDNTSACVVFCYAKPTRPKICAHASHSI